MSQVQHVRARLIPEQIDGNGAMWRELSRVQNYGYSLLNLKVGGG